MSLMYHAARRRRYLQRRYTTPIKPMSLRRSRTGLSSWMDIVQEALLHDCVQAYTILIQCENQNSTLAKLDSRSELEWIYQRLLARNEPVHFWIGGNRLKRFEEWRWVSDGQRIEFFDFYKTQPNQNTSLCIVLWHPFKYDWAD
ncbi:hypothetical protein FSP39_011536 [Pinctada imbricata]|uniref:C-type lectin domain-containing protein n=1 Tax=Pinctada imbricata TaxID=66713 RepID=A0AA88XU19_PINIB|nr:hypothetical protein FSP39_011536 [Pinctada imbricata]